MMTCNGQHFLLVWSVSVLLVDIFSLFV